MSRIRTIKPEFPQSETIGLISRPARLLFIQIWTICDDHGRCRAALPYLVGQLYPYDDDALENIGEWLNELEKHALVYRYVVDGKSYLEVPSWTEHQRVDNAGKEKIPRPLISFADSRGEIPRNSESVGNSPLDLGPRKGPEGVSAREAESDFRQEVVQAFERIGQMAPDTSHAVVWLRRGHDPSICLSVIGDTIARKPGIRSLKYFDQAIADAHVAPVGVAQARAGPRGSEGLRGAMGFLKEVIDSEQGNGGKGHRADIELLPVYRGQGA